METNWKKGQFIVNPKADQWGVGVITEDSRGNELKAFFEHECAVKVLRLDYVQPKEVEPGPARSFLENALVDDEYAGKYDREPFPTKLKRFIEDFPGGFTGEMLKNHERDYKWAAHEYCIEHLNQEMFKAMLETEQYSELATEIKRLYSKVNLLASFEMIKLNDALKDVDAQKNVTLALYDLLYGESLIQDRFNNTVKEFSRYEMDKWPTVTYPLFIRYPETYLFVKPSVTKEAAANRGYNIAYTSDVKWDAYQRILNFGNELAERLNNSDSEMLHPKDMIDVQSFMWCMFTNGWTKDEIDKAKLELGL